MATPSESGSSNPREETTSADDRLRRTGQPRLILVEVRGLVSPTRLFVSGGGLPRPGIPEKDN